MSSLTGVCGSLPGHQFVPVVSQPPKRPNFCPLHLLLFVPLAGGQQPRLDSEPTCGFPVTPAFCGVSRVSLVSGEGRPPIHRAR